MSIALSNLNVCKQKEKHAFGQPARIDPALNYMEGICWGTKGFQMGEVGLVQDDRRVNVLQAAMVSAAVLGLGGVVFVPALSFVSLITSSASGRNVSETDQAMVLAVIAPLIGAVLGFASGILTASFFNLLIEKKLPHAIVAEEEHSVRSVATVRDNNVLAVET